jgi:hypothetical protein
VLGWIPRWLVVFGNGESFDLAAWDEMSLFEPDQEGLDVQYKHYVEVEVLLQKIGLKSSLERFTALWAGEPRG